MTLNEALQIFGMAMLIVISEMENHETVSLFVTNAIMEEWFDGNLEHALVEEIKKITDQYGTNTVRQAARKLANKDNFYGDVT